MRAYVTKKWYGQRGGRMSQWWWFFTDPFEFSVFWQPDGKKTMEEFRDEQVAAVRAYLHDQLSSPDPTAP